MTWFVKPSSSPTWEFLARMSNDKTLQRAYRENPEKVLAEQDLSDEARVALTSKDPDKVLKHLADRH